MKRGCATELLAVGALVVLAILLGKLQTAARTGGRIDPVSSVATTLVYPASRAVQVSADTLADVVDSTSHGRMLAAENRRLRALEASAAMYDSTVDRLQAEVDELRALGGWPASTHTKVPADVVAYFPSESRITLNVGAAQGIRKGMPVVTAEGILARVEAVGSRTCQALLITSSAGEARISALVLRKKPNPSPAGLLRGESADSLRLELADPTATVESGDLVVTSGFSQEVPKGLVIGTVVSVEDDPAFGKRTAIVFPRVSIGRVREVMVIR